MEKELEGGRGNGPSGLMGNDEVMSISRLASPSFMMQTRIIQHVLPQILRSSISPSDNKKSLSDTQNQYHTTQAGILYVCSYYTIRLDPKMPKMLTIIYMWINTLT
jgi:hypothetical protein